MLSPTTRPCVSTSGPPELPGAIAASVWYQSVYWPQPSRYRSVQEMMPIVTERARPQGAPIASTTSPTVIGSGASVAAANGGVLDGQSSLRSATSRSLSLPSVLAV